MSDGSWQLASPFLDEVLDLDEEQREVWLQRHPDLAAAMRSILTEHSALNREGFLETRSFALPNDPVQAGQAAGVYTLLSQIGQGGMGVVWLAERNDGRFERKVAVKFLSLKLDGRDEERFRREARLLSRLSHPHIAELLDAGMNTFSQPYLVLEYVDGMHIDKYCAETSLSIRGRIILFLDVALAVAHAHANLIVHRDIKPSNVLVDRQGRVKLLDFGIAKWIDTEGLTEGTQALSPEYAAPEQLKSEPVTVATDVFMLAGLLYLILTGQKPIGIGPHSSASLVQAVVHTEPPPMSKLAPELRGDLDTIVAKALKKVPGERYVSVDAMADDLRRYLSHRPIAARPDSAAYRISKFVRRNRLVVALGAIAILAMISGLFATIVQARRANEERDFAFRQLERAEAINDLNSFVLSDAAPLGKPFTVNELLQRAEAIVGQQTGAGRLDLLISIGRQYWTQDEDAKARRVLEEAYGISQSPLAACALASSLARGVEQSRASALIEEGLKGVGQEPRHLLDRVFCLARAAEVARNQGASGKAIGYITDAQTLLGTSSFSTGLLPLRLAMDLAEGYRVAGRHAEAADAFARAEKELAALGRDRTQTAGTLLNNWALTLSQLGLPLEAESRFLRAIEIAKVGKDDRSVSSMLLLNYARALRDLGRLPEASKFAERAYDRAQAATQQVVINQALILRGSIYRDANDFRRSNEMFSEVEPLLRKALPAGHMAFASISLEKAMNAQAAGDLAAARALVNGARGITEAAIAAGRQGKDFMPTLLVKSARLALLESRPALAVEESKRAIALLKASFPTVRHSSNLGRAFLASGLALEAQGKAGEARNDFAEASKHLEFALGANHPDTKSARSH